jgi:tetratricopeptide (TPR) repeat protein
MFTQKNQKTVLKISLLVFGLGAVTAASWFYVMPKKKQDKTAFIASPRYHGDFWATFPYTNMDSAANYIAKEVPPHLLNGICETAYYNIDDKNPNLPDSCYLRLLDMYDRLLPQDTIRWLTQKLRGEIFIDHVQFDTARVCLEESLALCQAQHQTLRTADANYQIAGLAFRELNYPEAIDRLLQIYEVYGTLDSVNEGGRTFGILKLIPKVYHSMGAYDDAKVWYQKLWQYVHSIDGSTFHKYQVIASAPIANNYLSLNQVDSAKIVIDLGFKYQALYKTDDYYQSNRYFVLGKVDLAQGNCSAALAHTKIAIAGNVFNQNVNVISVKNSAKFSHISILNCDKITKTSPMLRFACSS